MPTLAECIALHHGANPELSPRCSRGHERAIHERLCPAPGRKSPVRICLACQRERARARNHFVDPAHHPDDAIWAEFCRTIEDRIEAMRLEDAPPVCPTCGSWATPQTRRCYRCADVKPISAFVMRSGAPLGYAHICLVCHAARETKRRADKKRQAFRAIIGRAS